MRLLAALLLFVIWSLQANAQFGHKELQVDLAYFNSTHKDHIPANYFIDSAFYKHYGLKKVVSSSTRLLALEGDVTGRNDILMVMECIWKFDNKQQVDSFITKYTPAFTLNGIKIKAPNVVPGATHIAVYKDGEDFKKWNKSLKQPPSGFYNFVFAIGNIVINVYVQTRSDVPLEVAQVVVMEAADKVKSASAKGK